MQLFVDDDGAAMSGSARLVSFGDAAGMEKTLRARVSRPDHHHFASKPVDFVKIDAEGHEPEVWTGLHQIRQNPDFSALIEWAPDRYEDPAWLLDQFAKEGFSTYVVTDASKVAAASRDSLLNVPEFEMVLVVRPGARPL
jgi:hypothetical protein